MSSISVAVTSSGNDGHSAWSQRSNASGTSTNGGTVYPFVGPHYDTNNFFATYFIFQIDNVPQGALINSCNLEIKLNNAYTGGLTNHIYVAVENNLDPTGTGAIVNGTLGSQPWQRLGRQSAAVGLLGNRCGPTHSKPGYDLSSYGAHVRDTDALIYKAYCTDQGNASALGRDLPAGSWSLTEDFKDALQPLVSDPAWNSSSQNVLVWLFADAQSGTDFNIGSLASYSWNNGTVGASGYGNGGGQIVFWDQSSGAYAPKMNLDYTATSLKAINQYSVSGGSVRLRPALCLALARGERVEALSGGATLPGISLGAHDLPFSGMLAFNSNDPLWNNGNPYGARVKWSTMRPGRVDGKSLFLEDYAAGSLKTPQIWWDINKFQDEYPTRDVYSLRFYHRYEQLAYVNINNHVVSLKVGGTTSFWIEHQALVSHYPAPDTQMELRIVWTGGSTPWTTYQFTPPTSNGYYRYEIQVDANQSPKVRCRIYLNDNITPLETIEANPITVEMNKILFGDGDPNAALFHQSLADIEVWSDYTLNKQYPDSLTNTVGTPYSPPKWAWFEYDGTTSNQLEDLGTVASVDPGGGSVVMSGPSSVLTYEDYEARMWRGDPLPYTEYSGLSYGLGTFRKLDLYVPNGTAPPDGWPTIVYNHGGFWASRNITPEQLIDNCIVKGYAFADCTYVLSDIKFQAQGSYPAWDPFNNTGRYPSHILNFKEASYWLKTKSSTNSGGDGTYNLNADKFVALGHSAGSYNALAAVVSRGLTNDGAGRDLTLAGNTATFGCPNVADPSFIGAYSLSAPIDLGSLRDQDPTHPDWPYLGTGSGTLYATCRMFMGRNIDTGSTDVSNTNIDNMVTLNPTVIPSICYCWGSSDYLVVNQDGSAYSQKQKLITAMNSVSAQLPPSTTLTVHETPDALHHTIHDVDMDYQHMFHWLENLPDM